MVEGAEIIAYDITRYAVFESTYLDFDSKAVEILKGKLVNLYTVMLRYLVKAKRYFEENTALRILKSSMTSR